jgi:hypothetical protein
MRGQWRLRRLVSPAAIVAATSAGPALLATPAQARELITAR